MTHVKTAVSLQESLFSQAEALARELAMSRSRLYATALEAFIRRHESRRLLAQINAASEEPLSSEEAACQAQMRAYQRRRLEHSQ